MKVVESLYDTSMSEHKAFAKDVLEEVVPKLVENAHYFKSKSTVFSVAATNKYIWTMRINLKNSTIVLCKYKYKYWKLPQLEINLLECFMLEGEAKKYFLDKVDSLTHKLKIIMLSMR